MTTCPEANRLRMVWYSTAAVLNGIPEGVRARLVIMEQQDPEYQAAKEAYTTHLRNCDTCRVCGKQQEYTVR